MNGGQVGNHQLFALDLGPLAASSAHGISDYVGSLGVASSFL